MDIIVSINTQKIDQTELLRMADLGATIVRLNGAHLDPNVLPSVIAAIRDKGKDRFRIMLDLPGNKIRTCGIQAPIALQVGQTFQLYPQNFSYPGFIGLLKEGDLLTSQDGRLHMRVDGLGGGCVTLRALSQGHLDNNRGVHRTGGSPTGMPFLLEKDHELIRLAKELPIDILAISYVRSTDDIGQIEKILAGCRLTPLYKIETREAIEHLDAILGRVQRILIDRGDLSSEIGLVQFPDVFNRILDRCRPLGKEVFVATQLFASMIEHNRPFISEVMEFDRLVKIGIQGIQLSDETAIGHYPMEVLEFIAEMARARP